MSDLHLDYQDIRPFPWLGVLLLAMVTGVLLLAIGHYRTLHGQLDEAVRQSRKMGQAGTIVATPGREMAQEVSNANSVLRQLSVPWETLFQAVEAAAGSKVTLLTLEPDVEKAQVKISGETRNYRTLLGYLSQLQAQAVFSSVSLQSHQVQQQEDDKPTRFTLLVTWRGMP
jgi:Tfp pilus assembly protein PilN